ncbi:MAG: hypothetical protein AB1578_03125 [Thermodesulfobacteriota bacterium]
MRAVGKIGQALAAGCGFLAGYSWGVYQWAQSAVGGRDEILRAALLPGGALSAGYALLTAGLFWAWLPAPSVTGLRAVVAPVAFTASVAVGLGGIRAALWLLGG